MKECMEMVVVGVLFGLCAGIILGLAVGYDHGKKVAEKKECCGGKVVSP
jgi:ABC-type dipeptide/oligopeptide/nickel transport system permease subunit